MADPVSATIIGVGAAGGAAGKIMENLADADRADKEAAWFKEQGKFMRAEGDEAIRLTARQRAQERGQQITAIAGSGFAFGADEASLIADTDARIRAELAGIEENTQFKIRESLLKGQSYDEAAKLKRSFGLNALGVTSILGNAAGPLMSSVRKTPSVGKAT